MMTSAWFFRTGKKPFSLLASWQMKHLYLKAAEWRIMMFSPF